MTRILHLQNLGSIWRGVARSVTALTGALSGLALLAGAAAADPLDLVVAPEAAALDEVLVDDATLSDIRGLGAEPIGADVTDVDDVAVILWDELKRPQQQGQSGSGYSQSSGRGIGQSTSLTLVRY